MNKPLFNVAKTPSLQGSNSAAKRQEILDYFVQTFELFESLFEPLASEEVFYKQPEPTRHPLIFYYGHTAVFYINKLILSKVIQARLNPHFEAVFAVGVDEMVWDEMHPHGHWPDVLEVKHYRAAVKEHITYLIQTQPLTLPITWEDPFWWVLLMGIEHERIHLETSSVLHRQLDIRDVIPHEAWPRTIEADTQTFPRNALLSLPASQVVLGKATHEDYYSWDNEYGQAVVEVESIEYGKYLVSNGEFMPFVKERGYENEAYWSAQGWAWLERDGRKQPYFWHEKAGRYYLRTMLDEMVLPLDWPVEVNFHEAQAFCRYLSQKHNQPYRLPTEAEWLHLAHSCGVPEIFEEGNLNLKTASSVPVNRHAFGSFYDVVGNVWQWCDTPIDGYAGFRTHPIYDDFSVPTFDGDHYLIKGGSWISTGNELLRTSRYAFRPHFMQHAGFRYVVGEKKAPVEVAPVYETDAQVAQYCDFHYGCDHFGIKNFSAALVECALPWVARFERALDLGCAVGRVSFELSKNFAHVTGADFSARFIQAGTKLQQEGALQYARITEGELTVHETVRLASLGAVNRDRIEFVQADACNLKPHLTEYDLVIAANLIDRLYEPRLFLESMKTRLRSGGILLIASPYSWDEDFTQKHHWLGGYTHEEEAVTTLEGLKAALLDTFELVTAPVDIPFVIRETQRKFQHTLSEVTIWKRI